MKNSWIKKKFNELDKSNKSNHLCVIGEVPETSAYIHEDKVIKKINKNGSQYILVYGLKLHKVFMDLYKNEDIDTSISNQTHKIKEIIDDEIREIADCYIGINSKNIEINSIQPEWKVLTNSMGIPFITTTNEVILIKYYRMTPTNKFLSNYHTCDELKNMEKEEQ